ncbi:MAG TPA: UvrD-helicase domain-containing protein [Thermoanaerobaculia bacterium]|nr:UvrD-helicase domain-containing protein [Thermoanaerobaculia bacterium]
MTSQQSFVFNALPQKNNNLVIEAGAGTGKTTAIVAEVLKLLLENESMAPERIVLVTFTEKAAGEIAERIHQALADVDAGCDAWPPGSARPLYVVTDAARRACETQLARIDNLRSQTIHSFCQMLLRQFPIEAGLDPQFRIVEGFERSMLYGDLYDAWVDAETRLHPNPEHVAQWELLLGHAGYLFMIREAVLNLLNRRDLLADETLDAGDVAEFEKDLQDAVDAIRAHGDAASRITRYVRENAARPRGLDAWIDYLAPIAHDIRTEKLKRNQGVALKVLRWGDIGDSAYDRLVSHRAAVALLALTRRFIAFLDEEKRKLGVVDFDDLLLRTAALLDNESVLGRVRQQFDTVFVDEFQDTDRVQARILDRLGHGTTVVVGDPKQSIYGFRRADPETYDAFTQRLVRDGAEHRVIRDQYRSHPALLDAFNAMFSALFANAVRDPNVFRPPYHELVAAKDGTPRDAHITFLAGDDEPEQVASWIAARGGELRRYAILVRRRARLDDYLDALDRHGIDYVLPPTGLFLDRPVAVDLVGVLRAIAWPFDRGAEISAARSPYFALTDDEIVSGGDAFQAVRAALAAFREASRHLTVAQLIEHVIATTNIEAVYAASADGDRALRHLEHLRALAFTYDRRIGGSVRQFVDEIAQRRKDPEEMEPSLLDDSSDAVRIMTVHAAKGLEFDTVILPDLAFNVRPQEVYAVDEPRSLVLRGQFETLSAWRSTGDGRTLRDIGRAREEAELHRLFYVAVTRAKSEVVFVCGEGKSGFAKCVHELFGPIEFPAEPGREVRTIREIAVAIERAGRAGVPAGRRRRRLADPALESQLAAADPVDVVVPTPPAIDQRTPAEINISRARNRNRPLGIAVHRVLERWDGTAPLEPLIASIAREQDVDEKALRTRVATLKTSAIFQRIAAAETVGREVPIRFLLDGAPVERRIDRWIRETDADVVVDYKSGDPTDRDREQVTAYCEALRTITGRPTRGLLWYIESDRSIEL